MAGQFQTALKAQKKLLRKGVAATLNALTSSMIQEQCVSFTQVKKKKILLTQRPLSSSSPRNNGKSSHHTSFSRM